GVGNYALSVQTRRGDDSGATLYFIDSNAYSETNIDGYGWIRRDQIEWYLDAAKKTRGDRPEPLPALAFFHIPIPEYDEVWDHRVCYGHKYEPVCAPRINTGFFAAMHQAGDVLGTFVGHDHVNDYDGELHGIRLCYGRQIGVGTYGREGFPRGARVIELTEGERSFKSWLRLEDGSRVDSQPTHEPQGRVLST
ncbi:MAG: metallophosphoesterase family protein, partial [Candidatus Poribacteria bacterium]|nr:metallophosphoesterase family protein [Candidatus Poribacteria bacterium]